LSSRKNSSRKSGFVSFCPISSPGSPALLLFPINTTKKACYLQLNLIFIIMIFMKTFILFFFVIFSSAHLFALMDFGAEEIIKAAGSDIDVGAFSVPSFFDWNNDSLDDLIIGDSSGKVRVFLNNGTINQPAFSNSFFVQANGSDLQVSRSGCLGSFPRVVYWDDDAKKDLLVGDGVGYITIFINTGSDTNPVFDAGTYVQAGSPVSDIYVSGRATSSSVDWNDDGTNDIISGQMAGKVLVFINQGSNTNPVFQAGTNARLGGSDLSVPSNRSSPDFYDFDNDGKKDLICGNTDGNLLFYKNTNTVESPVFSNYVALTSLGVPIDLPNEPRSRPSFCDWNNDPFIDVLIGAQDGNVHLFPGTPEPSVILALFFLLIFFTGRKRS